MKKSLFLIAAVLFLGISFQACQKDNLVSLADQTAAEDIVSQNDLAEQAEAEVEELIPNNFTGNELEDRGNCATVTYANPQGTWPNTMTIDYGAGCTKPDGRTLKGKIIVEQTNKISETGAVRTISFQDFYIDNVKIEGSKTLTNTGLNSNQQPVFTKTGNLTLLFPNGDQATYTINHTRTMIEGAGTDARLDNVWSIEGTDSGVSRDGDPFTVTITTPLIKRFICPWISSGTVEFVRNGNTRTLDFGNGECNRDATLTRPDGSTRDVKIRRRWWM